MNQDVLVQLSTQRILVVERLQNARKQVADLEKESAYLQGKIDMAQEAMQHSQMQSVYEAAEKKKEAEGEDEQVTAE